MDIPMAIQSDTAQLATDINKLAQLMRQQIQNQSQLAQSALHVADSFDDLTDIAHEDAKALRKHHAGTRRLNEDERRLLDEYQAARRRVIAAENKKAAYEARLLEAEEMRSKRVISQAEFDKKKLEFESKIAMHESSRLKRTIEASKAGEAFEKAVKGMSSKLHFLVGLLSTLGGSVLNFNKKFMEATSKSAGVIEETTGSFDQGMGHWLMALNATGVESKEMLGMMAQNRQMVNAMGGMTNTIKETESAIERTRGLYGSQEEAWRQNLTVMTSFANKGVKPSTATLRAYNDDLDMLARQTGMAGEAMNAMISSINDDTDSITILRAARSDEREAILANQRALLKSNIALGMTAQQASEAAKMLNKMVAQKPLDRLKQAAKMRAMGAAMGLGPESERAAQAVIAGKRATAQQRQDLSDFGTQVTNAADQAAQQGLGQEIMVSALMDKLDFEQYFGAGSPFSTTLADTNKSQLDLNAQYKSSSDSTIVHLNYLADIGGQMLNALLDGTILWGAMLDVTRSFPAVFNTISNFFGMQMAEFKDFGAQMHNIGQYIAHIWSPSEMKLEDTGNVARFTAEAAAKQTESNTVTLAIVKEAGVKREAAIKQEAEFKKQTAEVKKVADKGVALGPRAVATPAMAAPVKIIPDNVREGTDKLNQTKAEEVQKSHTDLLNAQVSKIDEQLKQMTDSNKYLKIISDAVPTLVDLAGKQLAAATMSEDQRRTMASRLKGESAKFSSDYSYAL